jgi:hypothetical protein
VAGIAFTVTAFVGGGAGDDESDGVGLRERDVAVVVDSTGDAGTEGVEDAGVLGTLWAAGDVVRLTVSATPPPMAQRLAAMPR